MFCYNCGAQNADDMLVCTSCGASLSQLQNPQPVYQQPVQPIAQPVAQPVYQQPVQPIAQPVAQPAAQTTASGRKKSSVLMIVLAVVLAFFAIPTAATGCLMGCVSCIDSQDEPNVVEPMVDGRWYYYDSTDYMKISGPDSDGLYTVDSKRLSAALFGSEDAEITLDNIVFEQPGYSSATLTAVLDDEEISFIVYFNEHMLTLESSELGRLTLCRAKTAGNDALSDVVPGSAWSCDYDFDIAFEDDNTGTAVISSEKLAFSWELYGDYLVIYISESDTHIVWHAAYDADMDTLCLSRFQESSIADTASVVWNQTTLSR